MAHRSTVRRVITLLLLLMAGTENFACQPNSPDTSRFSRHPTNAYDECGLRDVLALRQRVVQAQGLKRQAGIHPAPTLEAEGASTRPLGSAGEEAFSAAFTQPIETSGKRTNRVRVAELSITLAEAELDER